MGAAYRDILIYLITMINFCKRENQNLKPEHFGEISFEIQFKTNLLKWG